MQQEHVVPASDATLAACSASLAHALQELWRARVWGCSLCLAGSDPFTISTMPGPQENAHGERLRGPVSRGIAKCHNPWPCHPGLVAGPSRAPWKMDSTASFLEGSVRPGGGSGAPKRHACTDPEIKVRLSHTERNVARPVKIHKIRRPHRPPALRVWSLLSGSGNRSRCGALE